MACSSCGTVGANDKVSGCASGGCNRLSTFDWLSNMDFESNLQKRFSVVEVRFKGGRKEFYNNSDGLELYTGDPVILAQSGEGFHLGYVALQGEIVRLQMKKKNIKEFADQLKKIVRKANEKDLQDYHKVRDKEINTLYRSRQIIKELKLKMKLSDVEYQADNKKSTFYYSAETRVDFRELIRRLATEFKVRVEMKQISLRHEAGRLGGIGSCGRELCCSTWLTDFKSVSTSAARYQNLSLNPSKLSGQCGRLKCCLNYELETYMDILKEIPKIKKPLKTDIGEAKLEKTDIFRKIMWFSFKDNKQSWTPISVERVKEILALNKDGQAVANLHDDTIQVELETKKRKDPVSGGFDDLDDLDQRLAKLEKGDGGRKRKKKRKRKGPPRGRNQNQNNNNPNNSNTK